VSALFDPSAVLSSMKALFPLRVNCPARLVISPLANSIAESESRITDPVRVPAVPNPAAPVTSRSAWLAPEPVIEIWDDPDNWSPAGVPDAGSDVTIATGDAVASASIGTVNSITDSSDLDFESAGTNTVTTSLDDAGHLHVDASGGEGGTILNIGRR